MTQAEVGGLESAADPLGGIPPTHDGGSRLSSSSKRGFLISLAVVCAAALAVRIAYVLLLEHPFEPVGDAFQYHHGANLLADGKGFIGAHAYLGDGVEVQSAQHPPLYTIALALPSFVRLDSVLAHQLWSVLIGTASVALIGVLGRRLAGPRAGLLAAAIAAVYPNLWVSDGLVMAETLSLFTTTLALLAAYRLWDRPSTRSAVELGSACALAALSRGEAIAFLPLIVVPWVVLSRSPDARERVRLALVSGLAAAVLIGPWVGFNLARFDRPVLATSTGFDLALVQGNCDPAYFGDAVGYYSLSCIPRGVPAGGVAEPRPEGERRRRSETEDESKVYQSYRERALDYIDDHKGRVPFVVFARLGRTWGFYRPIQQLDLDAVIDNRDRQVANSGLAMYYELAAGAVGGAVVLRRRRVPLSPLVAMLVTVTLAVIATWGSTRYRVSAEPVVVVLAAVGVEAILRRRRAPATNEVSATEESTERI